MLDLLGFEPFSLKASKSALEGKKYQKINYDFRHFPVQIRNKSEAFCVLVYQKYPKQPLNLSKSSKSFKMSNLVSLPKCPTQLSSSDQFSFYPISNSFFFSFKSIHLCRIFDFFHVNVFIPHVLYYS